MITKALSTKEIVPTGKHSASVVFFHGSASDVVVFSRISNFNSTNFRSRKILTLAIIMSMKSRSMTGDSGENLIQWIRFLICRDFQSNYIKFIFPTAPTQPYSALNGKLSNIWFDRKSVTIDSSEDRNSVANIFDYVNDLIKKEMELGIQLNRIVVGGYSMGGTLALYTGFHLFQNVAAVFTCSSFLNDDAMLFEYLKSNKKHQLPKLLYFHGKSDELVRYEWGSKTFNRLKELGVVGDFHSIENAYHELQTPQLWYLEEWFHKILPNFELRNKL